MKKVILPFLICFIILGVNQCAWADTATVKATAVRIRETASTNANIVTNVYQDDEVEILEDKGEWYKVKVGENVGFAKSEFFTKKAAAVANTTAQTTVTNETKPQNVDIESPTNSATQNEVSADRNLVPNQDNPVQDLEVGNTTTLLSPTKIRLIPNLATNAKTEIAQGTNVTIEAKLGNWYKITNQTVSGWVTKTKLVQVPNAAPPQEKPAVTNPEPEEPTSTTNTTPAEPVEPQQPVEKPKEPAKPTETENKTNKTAMVIVETARVRKSASSKAEIMDVLDEDDIVTILAEEGDFYKISSKIGTGYISKSLVKVKDVTSRGTIEDRQNVVSEEKNQALEQTLSQSKSSITGNDVVAFAKQYLGYPYVLRLQYTRKRI